MCDYSLHAEKTRDAERGDVLVVHQFNYMTKGLCEFEDSELLPQHPCAVCLKEGTELALSEPVVEMYKWPSWFPMFIRQRFHKHATATFRKIGGDPNSYNYSYQHHDGIEFPDGKQALINDLKTGQIMNVLQVPVESTYDHIERATREDWGHLESEHAF